MGLRINTNISAMNAHRTLGANDAALGKSLARLSSGLRINSASDDAAGLAIAEKFRAQVNGLSMAMQNSQDAINLLQTAEGALNETEAILQRMRELSVQAANDTLVTDDRTAIEEELDQLSAELDGIAGRTQYNTKNLLSGDFETTPMTFQIGANETQTISVTIGDMSATGLTAQSGTSTLQAVSMSYTLSPGEYYMAFGTSSATSTFLRWTQGTQVSRLAGYYTAASVIALPATVTFAAPQVNDIPVFGITRLATL